MNLLFYTTMPSCYWGGSEELWLLNLKESLNRGHNPIVCVKYVSSKHEKYNEIEALGVKVYYLSDQNPGIFKRIKNKLLRSKEGLGKLPPLIFDLKNIYFQNEIHKVIINQGGTFTFIGHLEILWMLDSLDTEFYLISQWNCEHQVFRQKVFDKIRFYISKFKHVFFVSNRNREVAERQICYRFGDNSSVVLNPIKNGLANNSIKHEQSGVITLAFIGRLDCATKGLDLLFQAIYQLRNEYSIRLNLYGNGEDEQYLKSLSKFYGLEEVIKFNGPYDSLNSVWVENKALILPSISEGMPLTVLETMSMGIPVITTDVGGNSDFVVNGVTGFLIEAPTVHHIKNKLVEAFQLRLEWNNIGENALTLMKKYVANRSRFELLDKLENIE
jgi:glycosyltransferase involved in cell wall biosynthesis